MELTQEQQDGLRYLADTRDSFVAAVAGLNENQLRFKPSPDRWSVADVVEHVGNIEASIAMGLLDRLLGAPPPAADRNVKESDAALMKALVDRSSRIQAPETFQPTGQSVEHSLKRMLGGREKIAAFLQSNPDLRQHSLPHPALGPLDGHQWMLAIAGHSARHTLQIVEVKRDPGFPSS